MERKYRLLIYLFALIAGVSLAGFIKSYLIFLPEVNQFKTVIHIHFLAFICWFALLIIQPLLIRKGKIELHRKLGKASYFLAPILVFTIMLLSHDKINRDLLVSRQEGAMTAFIALMDILSFSTCYVIAMVKKNNIRWHVAFIIGASLIVLNPGMARLFNQLHPGGGLVAAVVTPFLVVSILFMIEKLKWNRPILKSPYFLFFCLWTLEILLLIIIPQQKFWLDAVAAFHSHQ